MTLPRVHPASLVANHLIRLLSFAAVVGIIAVLRHALVRATAADLRSRRFLADAAHQLRTPIAGLQATAETLLMSSHTDEQETMLGSIAGTANRMGRLTNSLLQIARLDQGEIGAFRSVDVEALCQGEVDLVRHRCGPEVEVIFDAGMPPSGNVILDPDATREALSNLLDNARRHARHRIEIGVVYHDDHLCLTVSDDGPGLPAGVADAAFERFTSLDGQGGSGLGLPIARGYIERQGGDLSYRDGEFVIRLPR